MSFPTYAHYKDSGVEWLGEVPAHWEAPFFQRCVYVAEGQVNPENEPYRSMILVAPNHVESGTGRLLLTETAAEQSAESGKYLCQPGDVIYSKIRPALRKACLSPDVCLCSADMYPLRGTNGLRNEFLFWFLLSDEFSAWAVLESDRVAMPKINRESLKAVRLVLPTEAEQMGIAQFLHAETTKLDALITEQRTLIDLLKEKRQAVISHAVTKGLDAGVAMKDSGVEWLGEVPAHWDFFPIKRELQFLTSGSRGWADHYADEGPLFIRIGNLTRDDVGLDLSDIQRVQIPKGSEGERTRVQSGDVLFSITAYIGSVAVVPENLETAYVSQHVALARLNAGKLLPEWVAYFAKSLVGKIFLENQGYGGTKVQLSLDDVANLPVTVPPLDEQYRVISSIREETACLDALTAEAQTTIALLQERRSALISAAVTGKIDVRQHATEAA